MKDFIIQTILGIILISIGISNMKGKISLLHSYHRKRITEENRIPFGKKIGLGTIIIGLTIIISSLFLLFKNQIYNLISNIILVIGFITGLSLIFYALFKYNKGIF